MDICTHRAGIKNHISGQHDIRVESNLIVCGDDVSTGGQTGRRSDGDWTVSGGVGTVGKYSDALRVTATDTDGDGASVCGVDSGGDQESGSGDTDAERTVG